MARVDEPSSDDEDVDEDALALKKLEAPVGAEAALALKDLSTDAMADAAEVDEKN